MILEKYLTNIRTRSEQLWVHFVVVLLAKV